MILPDGPCPAQIMLVGEAPGEEEERKGKPFVGVSGEELNRCLQEAGILRSEVFVTNVCRVRPLANDIGQFMAMKKKDITPAHVKLRDRYVLPPIVEGCQQLWREIEQVRPNVIIAVGNLSMWALTGKWGITKWRGSMLRVDSAGGYQPKVIPTIHPAAVLRQWSWRADLVQDLRRAAGQRSNLLYDAPKYNFIIRPTFEDVERVLKQLYTRLYRETVCLSFDLETSMGHIACAGLAWTKTEAICIPFMERGKPEGYWTVEQEGAVLYYLYLVLTHPNARVVGQNLLYDAQYTYRHWHFVPRVVQDTMISQHAIFSDRPKALAYQASLYCKHYIFWKEDK